MTLDGVLFLCYRNGSQICVLPPVYFGWNFRAGADSQCVLQEREWQDLLVHEFRADVLLHC